MEADTHPIAGPELALDLVNTGRSAEEGAADLVGTPAGLLKWLGARGLGGARLAALRSSPAETARLLRETHRLREAIARAIEAFGRREPVPADTLFAIDRVLASSSVSRRLDSAGGRPRLVEEERAADLVTVLAPVALGTAELLTSSDPSRVRQCASTRCTEWFLDTSKGGRRKWCSMERCGNRMKAAKHRKRRRAS